MTEELLQELKKITPEEEKILRGDKEIEKTLYMSAENNIVDARKLLEAGKMIQVDPIPVLCIFRSTPTIILR